MKIFRLANAFVGLLMIATATSAHHPKHPTCKKRPNFVILMTDDQDKHLGSLNYQPAVQKYFAEQGTAFEKHFCTQSQCCPSRVSAWTGLHGHNTNVTDVLPPFGGYPQFVKQGFNEKWLPVWLQEAGYNTYFVGKLMNSHSITNYNDPFPKGFNGSDFLVEPNIYIYNNASFQRNQDPPKYYPNEYSTDLISSKSLGFLEDAATSGDDRPFILFSMPIGPHGQVWFPNATDPGILFEPPIPAERHKDLYSSAKIPRTESFNPAVPGAVSYLKTLPRWNQTVVDYWDFFYRERLRSLAAVDDMIEKLIKKLEHHDMLENTYFIYTTDNGFHIGQHRLQPGKTNCYEEDVNIPFYIRGPGVAKGATVHYPTSHIDLTPTIFDLAGLPQRDDFDGVPMPVIDKAQPQKYESVNIEFWGRKTTYDEGKYGVEVNLKNNTYKAIRIVGPGYNLMYAVWCTNDHELYDMDSDPAQMHNLYQEGGMLFGHTIDKVLSRLNGLMMVLKTCKGLQCIYPWRTIHPQGNVDTLWEAMKSKYDDFYDDKMPQVAFSACEIGYIIDSEGPQQPAVFS